MPIHGCLQSMILTRGHGEHRKEARIGVAAPSLQDEPEFRHISRSNVVRLDVARGRYHSVHAPCPDIARAIRLLHPSGENQMIPQPRRPFLWVEFRLIQFDMKDQTGPNNRVRGPINRAVSSLNDSGIRILARISGWSDYPVVRLSEFYCIPNIVTTLPSKLLGHLPRTHMTNGITNSTVEPCSMRIRAVSRVANPSSGT